MREVILKYTVYTYDELSEKAKQKVKEWYCEDDIRNQEWYEIVMEDVKSVFPHSDLSIQYSLSSCQGDGFNVYGIVSPTDVLNIISNKADEFKLAWSLLTETEINQIRNLLNMVYTQISCPINMRYDYCKASQIEFAEYWFEELSDNGIVIPITLLEKFENAVQKVILIYCRNMETQGYNYFYNPSDEYVREYCIINEYEFLQDGTYFI